MSTPTSPTPPPSAPEKSWQARISEATDALASKFVESISYDRRMYKQDIAGSLAHAAMLTKVGLITEAERAEIQRGLKSIEADIEAGNFEFDESLEDIHMVIEDALIKRVGEPGKKLHTGRSRNDQVALDLVLWLNGASGELEVKLNDICSSFVHLADRSVAVIMPSYTHVQRAQPISAAAEALAWCTMLGQDKERLYRLTGVRCPQASPLGSGAIAGSSLPLDPEFSARQFPGYFDGPPINSIYHTACRDEALDFLFALAMISQHLSRWAEQWIMYLSTEFSFIKIADKYTTSSSMMPQKKNPDMLELIRGRCGNVYGDLFALMTILKGLPIGYNRDLQEDKRILFRAYDTVSASLTMAAAIVTSAEFLPKNITPTLDRGFLDATSLAEYLVTLGVPFRTAHHIVGTLVAGCEKAGIDSLQKLSVSQFNEAIGSKSAVRVDDGVYACLGAANVVARYRSAGAAGGEPLQAQLRMWKSRLGM